MRRWYYSSWKKATVIPTDVSILPLHYLCLLPRLHFISCRGTQVLKGGYVSLEEKEQQLHVQVTPMMSTDMFVYFFFNISKRTPHPANLFFFSFPDPLANLAISFQ